MYVVLDIKCTMCLLIFHIEGLCGEDKHVGQTCTQDVTTTWLHLCKCEGRKKYNHKIVSFPAVSNETAAYFNVNINIHLVLWFQPTDEVQFEVSFRSIRAVRVNQSCKVAE